MTKKKAKKKSWATNLLKKVNTKAKINHELEEKICPSTADPKRK